MNTQGFNEAVELVDNLTMACMPWLETIAFFVAPVCQQ
jgi:hypothetical protein